MSFVTTQPAALTAAATALQALDTSMAAQNRAAAVPTTDLLPAAADPVSALQAAQFSAYGTWYQHVSAQAAAIHQMLVNTLGASAGSYSETEAANQAAAGSTSLSNALSGATAAQTTGLGSSFSTFGTPFNWFQNVGAAASDFMALCQGQFLPGAVNWDPSAPGAAGAAFMPTVPIGSAAAVGDGAAPVLAGVGQGSSLGGLSVPPGWAGNVPAGGVTPATLAGAGVPSVAPTTPPVTTLPAGVPSVASAGRGGLGFGAPRYGVKPTVMPKPSVV